MVLFFVILAVTAWMVGVLLSGHREDAFWGLTGRYTGAVMFLCGAASMILIGWHAAWDVSLTWCFLIGSGGLHLLQILNAWMIDPLHMQKNLTWEQKATFSGTIGNINFNASFNSAVLSVGMVLFFLCKEKLSKIIYGILLFLGFAASFCCRSDSVFLGIGVVFVILFWYALGHSEKLAVFWRELLLFWSAACAVALFQKLFRERTYWMNGVGKLLLDWKVLLFEALLFVCMGIWIWKGKLPKDSKIQHIFEKILLVMLLCTAAAVLLVNSGVIAGQENGIVQMLRLDDSWGSGRGYVWIRSVRIFRDFPLVQKLFGCGINCFSYVMRDVYLEEMRQQLSVVFIDAHNEYLQMLLSTGLVGFVGYFGMIGFLLKRSICLVKKQESALLGIAGIMAFLAQGLVNNAQVATLPVFFLQWGMYFAVIRNISDDPSEKKK